MAFDHRRVLALIRRQADDLSECLEGLGEADWDRPSACSEWAVADVVAHLATGAVVQRRSLERGLRGETSAPFSHPEEREELTRAKRGLPPAEKAADFRQGMANLLATFDGIQAADLEKTAWHQTGVYPLPWFFTQRLGETTFHARDVYLGLGRPAGIPHEVAAVLLPAYLDRLKRLFQPGQPAGLRAAIAFEGAGMLRVQDGAAEYLSDDPGDAADLTLRGSPETLVLLATGRVEPGAAVAAGQLRAEGDIGLVERWRHTFRPL